ncbi:MAG: hypothetical protein H0W07_03810, partial [Chloroflexi bacterium]|nr:hypothetical protein [Chloroflexota bacterium]
AYPPGAYPPGAYPPGAYPPGAYPPGAYPPGAYPPDPNQAPVRHAPYRDLRAGVPTIDDELPKGGLIRPSRVVLLVALAVSAGVVIYGFFVEKGGLQIPISVVGLVMLGVSLLLTALASLRGGLRASREGSVLRSVAVAIFGGLCALGAAGSFATSVFLGSLYQR